MQANDVHAPPDLKQTQTFQAATDPSAVLMMLVREALGQPSETSTALASNLNWEALLAQMWTHRLGGLVWPSISRRAADLPSSAVNWIQHFRDVTTRMNGANLLTMRRVMPRLQENGIPCLAYKGPVLQQIAYGSMFMRPSSDLDILVHPSDFKRAGKVIASQGYKLAEVCQSFWWKAGLGEQHFLSENLIGVTLDLHHRVQQPGCPIPRYPRRFLTCAVNITVGGHAVPTLSPTHSILLAAMSYVKALHHREPAARYAIDLVALAKNLTRDQWREIEAEACLQGLRNTLGLTVRAARQMLGSDTLTMVPVNPVLMQTNDATLIQMSLNPADQSIQWPRRRDLLHALCDNKLNYPACLAAMVGSDLLRQAAV